MLVSRILLKLLSFLFYFIRYDLPKNLIKVKNKVFEYLLSAPIIYSFFFTDKK